MRLFAALPVPESATRPVDSALESLRRELPAAKWVDPPLWHVTLAFFGEVEPEAVARLARSLAAATGTEAPFEARLEGLGAFPPRGRVRVVWLGFEPGEPAARVAAAVREAARRQAVRFDDKTFAPHVTVARARRPWPETTRRRLEAFDAPGKPFRVGRVALVSSRLGSSGPRYETVAEASLGGEAA